MQGHKNIVESGGAIIICKVQLANARGSGGMAPWKSDTLRLYIFGGILEKKIVLHAHIHFKSIAIKCINLYSYLQ